MNKFLNKVRNLDAYPKINEDFFNRTLSGGVITLVSSIVMLLLFFSELSTCSFSSSLNSQRKMKLAFFSLSLLVKCVECLLDLSGNTTSVLCNCICLDYCVKKNSCFF